MAKKIIALALITFTTSIERDAAEVGALTTATLSESGNVFLLGAGLLSFVVVSRRKKS